MPKKSTVSTIKHAQKESQLTREISQRLLSVIVDDPRLAGLSVTRVKLSPEKGRCTVFFYSSGGEEDFKARLGQLILYKPSLRAALAKSLQARYTPDLTFVYDEYLEKTEKIDNLIERLKDEGRL
jgi:ribosome-binding factor A